MCCIDDNNIIRGKDILWQCKELQFDSTPASFIGRMRLKCQYGLSKADKRSSYNAVTDCDLIILNQTAFQVTCISVG